MDDSVDGAVDLETILDAFTSAVRSGGDADVESWAARHPEHADTIRELFPTIVAMEGVKSDSSSSRAARPAMRFVDRLGDFRIVSEVGRGGMGVVYEAEQESLGRRVAVKVLPPIHDERRIQRFEREAKTAARLHHTNIVPIFGVGEHDGWHYYVMPLIRGVGLDSVIRALRGEIVESAAVGRRKSSLLDAAHAAAALRSNRFEPLHATSSHSSAAATSSGESAIAASTPRHSPTTAPATPVVATSRTELWRSIAEIARQAADALAYAHAQGVLHRDIKPANLLLDAHGLVWITDFGLAKAVETEGLTRSGDLVGTLQYMAPEQLHGRYDARTDIYGLGLVLYELLTLQPAFADGERGGLLRKIEQGRPRPPSDVVPELPRDLETIVLHAIQPDPAHRYQSAAELADDLQRFLEDRPVRARRATLVEHAWRWCRRNRSIAALAGLLLTSLIVGLIVSSTLYLQSSRASALANANLEEALDAFDRIFDAAAGRDEFELVIDDTSGEASLEWQQPASPSPATAAMLQTLIAFYERFAATNPKDLRHQIANAQRRIGDLNVTLRNGEAAIEAYGKALDLFRELDGGTRSHGATIAEIHNGMGRAWLESGDREKARAASAVALDVLAGLDSRVARFERARTHELIASTWLPRPPDPGRGPRGERSERGAQARAESTEPTGQRRPFIDLGLMEDRGRMRSPEIVENLSAAWEIDQELVRESPDNTAFQSAAARTTRVLVQSLEFAGNAEKKAAVLEREIERLESLIAKHPRSKSVQIQLATAYLATLPRRPLTPRPALAADKAMVDRVRRARTIAEDLLAAHPGDSEVGSLYATAILELARIHLLDPQRPSTAELEKVVTLLEQSALENPLDLMRAVIAHMTLVQSLIADGRVEDAATALSRGLETLDRLEHLGGRGPGRRFGFLFGRERFNEATGRPPTSGPSRVMDWVARMGIDTELPPIARVVRQFEEQRRRRPR
jgi:serine/threonine protein kinase